MCIDLQQNMINDVDIARTHTQFLTHKSSITGQMKPFIFRKKNLILVAKELLMQGMFKDAHAFSKYTLYLLFIKKNK